MQLATKTSHQFLTPSENYPKLGIMIIDRRCLLILIRVAWPKEQQLIEVWSSVMHGYISDLHWGHASMHTFLPTHLDEHDKSDQIPNGMFPNGFVWDLFLKFTFFKTTELHIMVQI